MATIVPAVSLDGLHEGALGMDTQLAFDIQPQPTETTCGPTCLQAVYRYYDQHLDLQELIAEIPTVEGGGTLGVHLACDALRRGFKAKVYTYNLQVFDPTWFAEDEVDIGERLEAQLRVKRVPRLQQSSRAYLEFLKLGGRIRFRDLTSQLIRKYLNRGMPILTGLSATYLYRAPRECGPDNEPDDVRGEPAGHFVVLCGYDREARQVLVADPLFPNPVAQGHFYHVDIERLICAIMLGVMTYDANLLIIEKPGWPMEKVPEGSRHADLPGRG